MFFRRVKRVAISPVMRRMPDDRRPYEVLFLASIYFWKSTSVSLSQRRFSATVLAAFSRISIEFLSTPFFCSPIKLFNLSNWSSVVKPAEMVLSVAATVDCPKKDSPNLTKFKRNNKGLSKNGYFKTVIILTILKLSTLTLQLMY